MKLTIDTERKVIEIDQAVNLKDLIKGLKKLLGDEWEEYSIEQRESMNYWPYYPYPVTYTDNTPPFWVDGNSLISTISHEN